ncbi:hypothetical protein MKD52_05145 [Helicobacter sp. CaF467b]|uniref:hypothetical protein n=1 Tax=Helicobacter sp. CaF467b TaxID=2919923 RepID=UPI001F578FDC|nr:hypothetical protein [Helicobacter sp. CaF467b]MCI2236216.1 hypothetical protein [Helicobacter sp. CaF467b]
MDIKSILGGVCLVLVVSLGFIFWLYVGAKEEIAELKKDLQLSRSNVENLKEAVEKQNQAIKALEIKANKPPKEIEIIKEIELKDESCQSMLEGYKRLFRELGK